MATSNQNQPPEGEVVYRRVGFDPHPAPASREPRIDPTLMPLLIGFALLLLFVIVLGNLAVRRVEDTSREALELEQQHLVRATLLLELRMAVTRLDNEARTRMAAESRHELRPPFDMRLGTARNDLSALITTLEHAPLSEIPKWQTFRDDLRSYLEITRDSSDYSLHGFETFQRVDDELEDVIHDTTVEQAEILRRSNAMQRAAARSIRVWSIIAILAGLFVTGGTLWEVQRRFRQTRRSMDEARREREFSNQMMQGMVSAIAAIDRHDRIRSANAAFFYLFPNASIGASIHDKLGSPEAVRVLEAATASHVTSSTYRGRWELNQNEHTSTFDVYSSPLEIDSDRGQLLTLVDVTEATAAEAALRRSEALAAVGEAAAQLAHEIKNPLGSIRLGVAMLRDNEPSQDALRTIALVERGIHHLNKLVVDVTQFSRRAPLELSKVELHDLIDSSLELVADRIQEKHTFIEKEFASQEIVGYWDVDQLREIFVNLLANAIDASAQNSRVTIATQLISDESRGATVRGPQAFTTDEHLGEDGRQANSKARIIVTDYGRGIDQIVRARIFEPFFTTKKRGTGLGLAIVKQILEAHGGSISAQSEIDKGASFIVDLPLSIPPSRDAERN